VRPGFCRRRAQKCEKTTLDHCFRIIVFSRPTEAAASAPRCVRQSCLGRAVPGIGVELDPGKMQAAHARYLAQGYLSAYAQEDLGR
jgi:hypothetical protein